MLYKVVAVLVNPNNVLTHTQLYPTYAPDQEFNRTYNSLDSRYVQCSSHKEAILPPLLEHNSPSEAHFYPLTHSRPSLLHTHNSLPFTSHPHTLRGLSLTLYASQDCKVASLHLRVDWWGPLGHAGGTGLRRLGQWVS